MVILFWCMKIAFALTVLWLTVAASSQESKQPSNGVLIGSSGQPAGEIRGVVIGQDGQPVKGIRLGAVMQCPGACVFWMSDTITNQAGEYRFQRLPLRKYSVFRELGAPPLGVVELTV